MTDKLFDNYIREKLKNHTSDVPAGMWDRIAFEKKTNKKGIFWWETLGAVMLLACMAAFFGWFGPLDNHSADKKIAENDANVASSNPFSKPNQPSPATSTVGKHQDKNQDAAKNDVQLVGNHPEDNVIENQKFSVKGKEEMLTYKPVKKADLESHVFSQSNTNRSKKQNNLPGQIAKADRQNNVQDLTVLSSKQSFSTNTISNSNEDQTQANEFHFADRLSLLAAKQKAFWENSFKTTEQKSYRSSFSSVDCPSERRGKSGFYVEFFGSPDVAFKNMKYKTIAGTNYGNMKDSTETKQLSYTIGMRLTKELGENLVFKTGLQYSRINERFDYRNENERNTTTVVTIRTITNSDGTTTTIRDTSIVEQVGYRVKTTYNHYRSFDIPVLFGYEYAAEDWKVNLNGGAVFNLSSWQEGDFLDTSYSPVSFTKSTSPIFKKKTGISLYGSISLIKSIGERTDLFAEPYLRYSLTDRTTSASPFTERFHTAGMLLGIRFKLNATRAAK